MSFEYEKLSADVTRNCRVEKKEQTHMSAKLVAGRSMASLEI